MATKDDRTAGSRRALWALFATGALLVLWLVFRGSATPPAPAILTTPRDAGHASDSVGTGGADIEALRDAQSANAGDAGPSERLGGSMPSTGARGIRQGTTVVRTTWGAGVGQLGHDRPSEGNAEGPMAFTVDPTGNVSVLDQVNGRIVRYDAHGVQTGTIPVTARAAQDIAMGSDGTLAVMDRLGDRAVTIMGPDGRVRGTLPLIGENIREGGGVTSVIVDGNDVYAEREHGPLVRLGDVTGQAATQRTEIPGRPTRDGLSYISAGMIDGATGRFMVNSIERTSGQHRFTRQFHVEMALNGIILLDTDRAGTIYIAVLGHLGSPEAEGATPLVRLFCLDPLQGRALGQATLPANTSPDETFRELTALDEGGVLYALRTDEGVAIQRYDCR